MAWEMGSPENRSGDDSEAVPVAAAAHWPGIRALILVISAARKDVPSTAGMQATVATSALFAARASEVVPVRMARMRAAVAARDFPAFGELAMRDSNGFHATCLDTWPPIFYLNDASRAAIRAVEALNAAAGRIVAAYTFDAGPNAVIFYEEASEGVVVGAFRAVLGAVGGWKEGEESKGEEAKAETTKVVDFDEKIASVLQEGVSRVIQTSVGEGPVQVTHHLIDEAGNPNGQ